ncbi:MAG: transglycosylase domain-containing protein [Lachnospiraceae bacterium]|nr:transglycosylase domain-containing protein [Lachnospiraceae bacterium]
MNYTRRGIRKKQQQLNSKGIKFWKMLSLGLLKAFLIVLIGLGVVGCSLGFGMFKGVLASAPDISNLDVTPTGYATNVYDCNGKRITKLVATNSNRSYVSMNSIPQDMSDAFVAIEDERFYEHNGIDIKGIARAGMEAVKNHFKFSQGASTITQQLLKNNVFDDWVSEQSLINKFKRKFQEQYLALELEKRLSKQDILELYMNSINLGQNTLGVQAASMRYFNKPVSELTLSECAVIAGITQNPSKYNPISHPEENVKRRERVLNKMKENGYITESEYQAALADDVYSRIKVVNESFDTETVNSYYVDAVIDQVLKDLMEQCGYNETQAYNLIYSGGLEIHSAQDPAIQGICDEVYQDPENYPENVKWYLNYQLTVRSADDTITNYSTEMFKAYYMQFDSNYNLLYSSQDEAYADIEQYKSEVLGSWDKVEAETISLTPQPQVSITVEDQSTGHVVAMVGGRGTKSASRTLNRATNVTRQPGSTFKVVSTYAPALDSAGLTLASVQNDAPFNYENGTPVRNWYGEAYKGICTLRYGIEQSLNIVAVKTLTQITPQLGYDYLLNFGFTTLVDKMTVEDENGNPVIYSDIQQALALGGITKGVTNMELNGSYATIANGGTYIQPALYTVVYDHDGNVLLDRRNPETRQVIKETTAFLLTDAMVDVVTKGTGASVNFGDMAIAGKTGTTSSYRDVWFAGYTPYYTATTWTGYDNNEILASGNGERNLSKTLWRAVMSRIHENLPNKPFEQPEGIVTATVCGKSGKKPVAGLCDGSLITEYFAEGTVPTDSCNVHYAGLVCAATGLPACDTCPYKMMGAITVMPDEFGNTNITTKCPHTADYYLTNPGAAAADAAAVAAQQQAAAAAAAAAQQQAAADAAAAAAAQQQAQQDAAAAQQQQQPAGQ